MAKKLVRGITDIKTISKQDFDTNNVNDLLSDGEHNYIHRKKGKNEEYHNLTDNIKTISSSNTDLIEVDNNNTTNNTATLKPKHDAQKEQVLESTRNTINIQHAENGTSETTKVDTNPEKVLEHENLLTDYGISKETSGGTTKLGLEYTKVNDGFDLNNIVNGCVRGYNSTNAPTSNAWYFVNTFSEGGTAIQTATGIDTQNTTYVRRKSANVWGSWREQVGDKSVIDGLLTRKQNTLTSSSSIGVLSNNQLKQLYYFAKSYSVAGGLLKTSVKAVSPYNDLYTNKDEYNFVIKINKGVSSVVFNLNTSDTASFGKIMTAYGENNSVRISGCVFTLNGSNLTVSTTNNTAQNYVITFSDII